MDVFAKGHINLFSHLNISRFLGFCLSLRTVILICLYSMYLLYHDFIRRFAYKIYIYLIYRRAFTAYFLHRDSIFGVCLIGNSKPTKF